MAGLLYPEQHGHLKNDVGSSSSRIDRGAGILIANYCTTFIPFQTKTPQGSSLAALRANLVSGKGDY
jgi:hypothetical protein